MTHRVIPIVKAETLIPRGVYCYQPKGGLLNPVTGGYEVIPCPFWDINVEMLKQHGQQSSGYCRYLDRGDWMEGLSFLWDQVKECGIKAEEDL